VSGARGCPAHRGPGVAQRRRGDGVIADKGIDPSVGQLRGIVAGHEPAGDRHPPEHFTRPSRRSADHRVRRWDPGPMTVVIAAGGYSSPPVLVAASLLGIRRVILEPNAYPGMANRVLGPLADIIFVAFEAAGRHFTPSKVRVVGTPIRRAFLEPAQAVSPGLPEVAARAAGGANRTLLIFGGSQGAHAINAAMLVALPHLD